MGSEEHWKREQKASVPVTGQESRVSCRRKEEKKLCLLEGGQLREELKRQEDNPMEQLACLERKG